MASPRTNEPPSATAIRRGWLPWVVLAGVVVAAALVVGLLARPQGEDARATATLAVTVLIATAGFFESARRARAEHRHAAMREAGKDFCTAVAEVSSALTGLRFALEAHPKRRERIEKAMEETTRAIDNLQATTARVEFAFPAGQGYAHDWPSDDPAAQRTTLAAELAELTPELMRGRSDAVTTAQRVAVITRHCADALRNGLRDAFAKARDDDAAYRPVFDVLNGLPDDVPPSAPGATARPRASLRTSLDELRRKFVRHALETMD
jgi:septal ring factor EnvC (AmiA/AmiB activator)